MNRLLHVVLLIAALQASPAGPAQGVINGRVTNSTGAEGIPDVSVLLVGPLTGAAANAATFNPLMIEEIAEGSGTATTRATTDQAGRVVFRNLASGQYMLKVQKDGYLSAVRTATGGLSSMATASTIVNPGAEPVSVRLPLLRSAVISGRVRDAAGQPMPNMSVVIFQLGYRDGRRALTQVASRRTDDRGEYRLFGQAPGQYYVAVANNASPLSIPRIAVPAGPSAWCCKIFYPSTLDADSAVPVNLSEGAEVSGIDIGMRSTATFRVSGRVINLVPDSAATTPSLFFVRDSDVLDPENSFEPGLSMTPDGNFELRGVPAGSYQLVATVSVGGRTYPGHIAVNVATRDVEGVSIAISPGTEVRMRLVVDGNVTVGSPIRLQLRPRDTWRAAGLGNNPVTADSSGTYVFRNISEGAYSVVPAGLPANSYVADVLDGGRSIYDSGLAVGEGPAGPIDVIVNSGARSIRGVVRNADGNPVSSANVVLLPPPARRENSLLYRTVRTDATGAFALSNIAPGEYKLFAWESLPNSAHLNAGFMEKYESRGTAVMLSGGGNPVVDLRLIPAEIP